MLTSFKTALFASTIAIMAQGAALAVDEYNVSKGVTLAGAPLGVHGVDTVLLTSHGAVSQGDAAHTIVHDGVAYYFASKETANTFKADPEKYAPQYGGYCTFAVALGRKLDGDPRYADIVDGKLYLFVNDAIYQKYKKNPQKTLRDAARKWPDIRHTAVSEL